MPSDPFILAFDTSAAHCAAALLSGDRVVVTRVEEMGRGQAERLMPLLEEVLAEGGIGWADLALIGVGIGPGNFTGIRISVAAARGLALGLGIPAVGVSTFEALAEGFRGAIVATVAAPQDKVYISLIGSGQDPLLCTLDQLPDIPARAEPIVVGERAEEVAAAIAGQPMAPLMPLAVGIARQALARRHSRIESPAPLYIRPADAAPASDPPPVILDA